MPLLSPVIVTLRQPWVPLFQVRTRRPRRAAGYPTPAPTLADALVRRTLETGLPLCSGLPSPPDSPQIPHPSPERLLDALCYAA